jgi:hypothetical protein
MVELLNGLAPGGRVHGERLITFRIPKVDTACRCTDGYRQSTLSRTAHDAGVNSTARVGAATITAHVSILTLAGRQFLRGRERRCRRD